MPQKKVAPKTIKKVRRTAKLGRPKGTGKFGCKTKLIRLPSHLEKEVLEFVKRKLKAE